MNGQPIQRGQPSLVITTDASLQGFLTSIDGLSEARVLPEFCSLSDHTAIIEELRFSCQNVIMYSGLTVVDSELSPYLYLYISFFYRHSDQFTNIQTEVGECCRNDTEGRRHDNDISS